MNFWTKKRTSRD